MPDQVGCRLSVGEAQKKFARAIFGVPDLVAKFTIFRMAAEISAALLLKLPKHQLAALQRLIYSLNKPAVQFWGQTRSRTFFFDKYLRVHMCIY